MTRLWVAALGVAVGIAVAYSVAGPLGAFLVAAVVFVPVAVSLVAALQVAAVPRRVDRPVVARPPAADFGGIGRLEVEVLDAVHSGRIYDHALRPRLYRLEQTLLRQQRPGVNAGTAAARAHVGEQLWPRLDPSVRSFDDIPKVSAEELADLLTRIEELR